MDEPSSLTPWKKRKTENEYSLCLICQEQSTVKVIKNPNNESLKKLLSLSRERAEYGDTKVFEFVERNKNLCHDDLLNNKACYHKKCYSEFTNIENRNRALRYNLLIADDNLLQEEPDSLAISLLARKYPLDVIAHNISKALLLFRDTLLHETTKASGPIPFLPGS